MKMDENQNFQSTSGNGMNEFVPQQSADNTQFGYQNQQSMDTTQYSYQGQQSAETTQFGYQGQQSAETTQFGYQGQQPVETTKFGFQSQQVADTGSQYGYAPQPAYNNQNQYAQNSYAGEQLAPVMTMGNWIVTYLLMCIPCLNIILMFIWAFSGGTNPNKKNFCRAMLIVFVVVFVVTFVGSLIFGATFASLMEEMSRDAYYY